MKKYTKHILIGLITGVLNGLFGAGGGSIAVPAMEIFLKTDEKKAHATAIAIILMLSTVSSFFYIRKGLVDWGILVPVTIGGIAGGVVGAKLLNKIPKKVLRIIFGGVIMATAIKMFL